MKERMVGILRGQWPRSWANLKLKSRIYPWTFRGMVLKQIHSVRDSYVVRMVDKFEARNLSREQSKSVALPKLFQVTSDVSELNPNLWPEEFVIKPSHGSGALVLVSKSRRPGLKYDIQLDSFKWNYGYWGMLRQDMDLSALKKLGEMWLKSNYEYWRPKTPEWAYGRVVPKLLVEELIVNSDGTPATEVRFHCFKGRVHIARITETITLNKFNWTLDRSGIVLRASVVRRTEGEPHLAPIPTNWDEAVKEAEKLSTGFDYVRVDLYATNNKIFFSEYTPYPFGGNQDFRPRILSRRLAKIWRSGKDFPLPHQVYK